METAMELYGKCRRFDEGELYRSEAIDALFRKQLQAHEELIKHLPASQLEALQAYTDTLYGLCEVECRHYFIEGMNAALGNKGAG